MRFWDADGGAVRVSGRDVREVNTGDLRRMEGFVTQETHLFRDSIASNLRIAKRMRRRPSWRLPAKGFGTRIYPVPAQGV
ncbi:MAG: hypothetical protein ACLRZH_11850 [Ruthenibacterium lactatiformans]